VVAAAGKPYYRKPFYSQHEVRAPIALQLIKSGTYWVTSNPSTLLPPARQSQPLIDLETTIQIRIIDWYKYYSHGKN